MKLKIDKKREIGSITPMLIIFIVSSVVYLNILPNGFIHDDNNQIVENPWLRDFRNLPAIFFSSVWSFLEEKGQSNYYRPVMHLVYMADYTIFGLKPWGWHLTSLVINSLNSVMVFVVTLKLLREKAANAAIPAAAGALLFAVHPVHTEAVAWAAGIPELTFAFFYLVSFYLYIQYRDTQRVVFLISSAISFFLSTLSKEPALTLPFALAAYDIFLRGDRPLPIA
ncbi:MAG: hypothetical protein HY880_08430, partial [Deltaproteobacteria bacterium]|nr:hypothetical protein [Deltaproteobacteria bacterium]